MRCVPLVLQGPDMAQMIEDSDEDDMHGDRHIFLAAHSASNQVCVSAAYLPAPLLAYSS